MSWTLKNRLADCLAAKGMKKSQLAFRLKMTRGYVTRLERGEIRPSVETCIRIARVLGRPVEEIFQLVEDEGKSGQITILVKNSFPGVRPSAAGETTINGGKRES